MGEKEINDYTPRFCSALIFAAAIPHSYWLYPMIWSDPCSDLFFSAFEKSMTWIATLNALEGASGVALGYIDYKTKTNNSEEDIKAMRKKRMAFAKTSFIMVTVGLFLIDGPSTMCVLPLLLGSGWSAAKMGTQIGFKLTPDQFFLPRTFLSIYNIVFLLVIWAKVVKARKEKKELEYSF